MHFYGLDEKLLMVENNIAQKLITKISTQSIPEDEKRKLYFSIMEIFNMIHSNSITTNQYENIINIIKDISKSLKNEIIYNVFWTLLLTHNAKGKIVPHEIILIDLETKLKDNELISFLKEKAIEIFPDEEINMETYLFEYTTASLSTKISLKANLRKREIDILIDKVVCENIDNVEEFLLSSHILFKDLRFVQYKVKDKNTNLVEPQYIIKNFNDLANCDNYYLIVDLNYKDMFRFKTIENNIMQIRREEKLKYRSIFQKYTEAWCQEETHTKTNIDTNWDEAYSFEEEIKNLTKDNMRTLLKNIKEIRNISDIKERI